MFYIWNEGSCAPACSLHLLWLTDGDSGTLCGLSQKRQKELIPFATAWMELESIMLSEISQAVRDKYHMISPLTGHNQQKKKTNKI